MGRWRLYFLPNRVLRLISGADRPNRNVAYRRPRRLRRNLRSEKGNENRHCCHGFQSRASENVKQPREYVVFGRRKVACGSDCRENFHGFDRLRRHQCSAGGFGAGMGVAVKRTLYHQSNADGFGTFAKRDFLQFRTYGMGL